MAEPGTTPPDPTDRPAVSVLIVAWNPGAERLARCLSSLAAQCYRDFEIILVDNACTDGSVAAQDMPGNLTLVEAGDNLGFAAGMNLAARHASGQWLALLNPDAVAEERWLDALMEATQRWPDTRLFGSVQVDAEDDNCLDGIGDVYHISGIAWRGGYGGPASLAPMRDVEIFAPCAAASLYRADLFAALGGFEESFFCYNEDVDLGFRARLTGERAILVAQAVVHHEGSAITGRRSAFTVYHGTKNRIRTFVRCMPAPLFQLALPLHVLMNVLFLIRAVPLGVTRAYWMGMIDGFFHSPEAWTSRRTIQAGRTHGAKALAAVMTASLGKLVARSPDLYSLPLPEPDDQVTD